MSDVIESVLVIFIDNPPVNGLGAAVRTHLRSELERALADENVEAIVLAGKGKMFSAGADIREFGNEPLPGTPSLPEVIDAVERSTKPVVAAIHGVAAGGGLELALGCHARIASADARVGLPEVTLGIIPGAGGTQRLPRLVGIREALGIITEGKLIPAAKAHSLGIVDEIVTGDLLSAAIELAAKAPLRRASDLPLADDPEAFAEAEKAAAKTRGLEAPLAAIEAVKAAVRLPAEQGFAKEREIFLKLVGSNQSKALRHVFFAEREAAKIPDVPPETKAKKIDSAGVIGCGTMGGGIAMCFANVGIPVVVVESEASALERGLSKIRGLYESSVSKGKISQDELEKRMALITGTTDFARLSAADFIVEAVFEQMEVKKDVFGKLDSIAKEGAVLATNTSSLDVNEIASATRRRESVIGTHFFSPANVMKLLESVRGNVTSKETIATVFQLAKRLDKVAVLVSVCDGFVGNRMLYAYRRQADFLLEEGALPHDVDQALVDFGLPMGPYAMADLAGLDIGWAVRKSQEKTRPKHLRYSTIPDRICELGRFGQKTGAGFYRYEKGSRAPIPDPEIAALVENVSKEVGIERRPIAKEEIVERCIYALINEGAKILEEGIALRASDIDLVWIHGYGFPRYRGGPMFYADTIGVNRVYGAVKRFHEQQGEWMKPARLLEQLAREGRPFDG
ncbi:MAG: 3-hydroxyacyl-CoA dehydrogenase NAD-binding domain-containing protein [Vicinamibacteria bacterium]